MLSQEQVHRVVADQCQYGQQTEQGDPLKKPTGFMSNAALLLQHLGKRCFGKGGLCTRPAGGMHVECIGKKAQRAAIFQEELCVAILRGIRAQLIADRRMRRGEVGMVEESGVMLDGHDEVLMAVREGPECPPDSPFARDPNTSNNVQEKMRKSLGVVGGGRGTNDKPFQSITRTEFEGFVNYGSGWTESTRLRIKPCQFRASSSCAVAAGVAENVVQARSVARHQVQYGQNRDIVAAIHNRNAFVDDLTGLPLSSELCRAARQKEISYFRAKGVWELRPVSEARAKMGRRPISVRWVETNKGDDDNPNIRSRLVAREIRAPGEDAIFAPTPPLESLRMIVSMAATTLTAQGWTPNWEPDSDHRTQILMIDISRAYFNAKTSDDDPIYVDLPAEAARHQQAHVLYSGDTCTALDVPPTGGRTSTALAYEKLASHKGWLPLVMALRQQVTIISICTLRPPVNDI